MKQLQTKTRILLCGFILLAFFLPAYEHRSAYQFIGFVRGAVNKAYDITPADAVISIATLLMIPFSAIVLAGCAWLRLPTRKIYAAMPLIFFLFFTGILFTSETSLAGPSSVNSFAPAGHGFYLAGICAVLLLFTKNPKRKSRRKRKAEPETGAAVIS